jgi:hypothetical protein
MYILAKKFDDHDGYTIHGLSESDRECDQWQAAGGVVFDVMETDSACFEPYAPLPGPNDEVATDE